MENQENANYTVDMLKQINQTILSLCQNQTMLFEEYKSLNEKMNRQYETLNEKMDRQYETLNQKMDKQYKTLNEKMDRQYKALNEKMDKQYETLNQKMDKQYETLNQKMDKQYEENRAEHIEMKNIISAIQKDVKDLRTDIDIVYDLEKYSRKKIKHLL